VRRHVRQPYAPVKAITELQEPIVRVRGLPWDATLDDIVECFADYHLVMSDVTLQVIPSGPRAGSPSGECFVQFGSLDVAKAAMQDSVSRTFGLGTRYLELFPSTSAEMSRMARIGALAGHQKEADEPVKEREGSTWIRLRGLPFSASPDDIVNLLHDYEITQIGVEDVLMKHANDGRPTGEGYVQLNTLEEADELIETLEGATMGNRNIEAFMSNYDEAFRIIPCDTVTTRSTGVLRLRGLPWHVKPHTVVDFLAEYRIHVSLRDVAIKKNVAEAYVMLPTEEDVVDAVKLCNHKRIGQYWIQALVSSEEHMRLINLRKY